MVIKDRFRVTVEVLKTITLQPALSRSLLSRFPLTARGYNQGQRWTPRSVEQSFSSSLLNRAECDSSNPLKSYLDSHATGKGIFKWLHFPEIYHRHFGKFVGRQVHVLEIGVYAGGSLEMWKAYFGPNCRIYGVDIREACKVHEDDRIKIFVGDQGDREFWKRIRAEVPTMDVVVDDGSHEPEHQIISLEELLPHLRPGGVYLCEDIYGHVNKFSSYVSGLASHLHFADLKHGKRREITSNPTSFQNEIHSIHLYPFVTVIEKRDLPVGQFIAPRLGTEWL